MSQTIPESLYGDFTPRYIGPIGNRVSAVAGVPGDPLVYYAGAAAGGIFKTEDGGNTWKAIFDQQAAAVGNAKKPERAASIGTLAVSESNPDIVWAGTGEFWIRGPLSIGNGVYKSTDAGESWTRMGLPRSGRISRILIHPEDPEIVWVAAVGSCYAEKNQQRGVYITTDGGLTWNLVLAVDSDTGCSDLLIHPMDPRILYAGMWTFKLRSWTRVSGGKGSGIYKSVDGGITWRKLSNGLPNGFNDPDGNPYQMGKIALGISRTQPDYIYANIETGDGAPTRDFPHVYNGQLFHSKDAGESWTIQSYNRNINSRPAYYTRNAVSPDNAQEVYFYAPEFSITTDGGKTIDSQGFPQAPGVDHHEGWIDPLNGDRMIVAHDNGVSITENRCKTWRKIQLPIAQIYQLGIDQEIPYNVYGNVQDWITFWGPSNARIPYNAAQGDYAAGKISRGCWKMGGNGECGWSIPDPTDPDLIWTSGASDGPNGGALALINKKTGHQRMITVKPHFTTGGAPKDVEYRFHWHYPLALSPHPNPNRKSGPHRAYAGSQLIHASDDRGQSWYEISECLTGYDEKYLQSSGGITADNLNVRMAYCTSFIVESPLKQGNLWVGTNDQRLWLGKQRKYDGNWKWNEINTDFPGLPNARPGSWAKVSCIHPSVHDAGTIYVAFDKHQGGDPLPYLYKTTDQGKSWKKITKGIPDSVFSYVHWITEDPKCEGLLFLGTENDLYVSYDGGAQWSSLPGLPPAPVSGLQVQSHFDDLVVSTFGRGFYIFDDMSPLRKLNSVMNKDLHLFDFDRPVYRFQDINQPIMVNNDNDPTVGSDPPSPAPISFYLKKKSSEVTIRIKHVRNGEKETIRTIKQRGKKGLNRVWWDLMSDTTQTIILRTNPPSQKNVQYCPESWVRPFSDPVNGTTLSWMALPGSYEVSLEVKGLKKVVSKKLILLKDPNSLATKRDLTQQNKLSRKIANTLTDVADQINTCEWLRYQSRQVLIHHTGISKELKRSLRKLNTSLQELEMSLFQEKITGQGEDLARFAPRLVSNLSYLGSIVGSGDYPPTEQARDRFKVLEREVNQCRKNLQKELRQLKKVNKMLKEAGLKALKLALPANEYLCPDLFNTGPAF